MDNSKLVSLKDRLSQAKEFIESAQLIAISGHTNPDGDCIGSGLSLAHAIKHAYPHKEVQMLAADDSDIPRAIQFLPGSKDIIWASKYEKDPDLFISVDTPKLERLRNSQEVFERSTLRIAFDHHPDFEAFADINFGDASASSCSIVLSRFFEELDFDLTQEMAECIYTGLITDTGRFQYQNTNAESFEVAAKAIKAGVKPDLVSLHVYQSLRLEYLHLEALVFARTELLADGSLAYSYVKDQDFEDTGATKTESDGLIDSIRRVNGANICLLLRENTSKGEVRGNLRSKTDYDVAKIAQIVGGGGHKAAAGFHTKGNLQSVFDELIPAIYEMLGKDSSKLVNPFED
ncbi:MAG: bifunctional oligoribonuclease/PAP phosphatase NrnA [Coriobacteriia bacterium]|nr:bifunctional oligoribonuclease/PAP phosphatase NrnA [Coriobacteriia bacterium]